MIKTIDEPPLPPLVFIESDIKVHCKFLARAIEDNDQKQINYHQEYLNKLHTWREMHKETEHEKTATEILIEEFNKKNQEALEPKYEFGFIPNLVQLASAFGQLPDAKTWPSDNYTHKFKISKELPTGETESIDTGKSLQFSKLNGLWHFFGPVKQ